MAFKLRQLAPFLTQNAFKVTLGLVALGMSASAWSFSLAHPNLLSHQGEPLSVEIELLELSAEEASGLVVSLASESTYQAAHTEWEPSLGNTQVNWVTLQDKRRVLRIASQTPVNSTFVDLLLDFHWASGSTSKEIGLLLDSAPNNTKTTANGAEIRVVEGDTAGEIAERFLDASTNLNQMLVALLRTNPKAFVDHNVNRMIAGQTLSIPSTTLANSISVVQAREDINLQNIDFAKYRESVLAKVNAQSALNPNHKAGAASGLVSQKGKALNTPSKDQLKLSQPNSASAKTAEQLARDREAQQNSERAKEIENNINELTQIANEQKSWSHRFEVFKTEVQRTFGAFWSQLPDKKSDLKTWLHHPLAPVVGGLGLGILILGILWTSRNKVSSIQDTSAQTQSPHDELHLAPEFEHHNPFSQGIMQSAFAQSTQPHTQEEDPLEDEVHDSHHEQTGVNGQLKDHIKLDFDLDLPHLHEPELEAEETQHVPFLPTTQSTPAGNPFISELAPARRKEEENPLEVRFDLAQELWQVGQHHTARAIVQEIAQQATGELLHQAQAWLAQKG